MAPSLLTSSWNMVYLSRSCLRSVDVLTILYNFAAFHIHYIPANIRLQTALEETVFHTVMTGLNLLEYSPDMIVMGSCHSLCLYIISKPGSVYYLHLGNERDTGEEVGLTKIYHFCLEWFIDTTTHSLVNRVCPFVINANALMISNT